MTQVKRRALLADAAKMGIAGALLGPYAMLAAGKPEQSNDHTYDVMLLGAKGDGRSKDTVAIQRAIDSCTRSGGGAVVLRSGKTFVSGTLTLKPHVELHIEKGAVLRASGDRDDFRALGSLLFAEGAEDVSISGPGTIDGNFHAFMTERIDGGYKVLQPFLGPFDPLYGPENRNPPDGRPRVILLVNCKGALLRDFRIRDAPTWTIHPIGCENLHISGLTIRNDSEVPNNDGIDIDHCRNVRIENCDISAGDDCIVLKSSRNFMEYGTCENVVVSNCVLSSRSAGIKIEPEGPSTIRMATFTGIVISHSNRGIAVLNRDGALIEDLIFSDFTVSTELQPAMWWGAGEPVQVSNIPRDKKTPPGVLRHLQFNNFICRSEGGVVLYGYPGNLVENVSFQNIDLTMEKISKIEGGYFDVRPTDLMTALYKHQIAGFYCEHARNVSLQSVGVAWAPNPPSYFGAALEAHDVEDLELSGFKGQGAHPGQGSAQLLDGVTLNP